MSGGRAGAMRRLSTREYWGVYSGSLAGDPPDRLTTWDGERGSVPGEAWGGNWSSGTTRDETGRGPYFPVMKGT